MSTGYDTFSDRILMILCYAVIFWLVIMMFYPFWDQFIMSISTRQAALVGGFRLTTWPINLDGYKVVLRSKELGVAALNTLFRVVVGTGFSVVVTALTAYPLSRQDLPFRRILTAFFVFTMFFSGGLIPTYIWVRSLGLINNPLVLILPGLAAYYLIIVRNFFSGMPQEIQEAAQIDAAKVAKIMEFWDFASTDKDFGYYIRYGKEGTDSERDAFGVPQIKKDVDRAKLGTSIGILTPSNIEVWKTFQRSDYDEITKYAKAGTTNQKYIRDLGVFMNPDITKVGPDLQLIQGKWEVDFISGAKGMDKWGDFVKEYMDKGGQAMKDEANRAYKAMTGDLDAIKKAIETA